MDDKSLPPPNFALTAAIFEGALVFLAVGLGWLAGRSPLETLHWDASAILLTPLMIVPPLILMLLCMYVPVRPFSDILQVADQTLVPLFRPYSVAEMAIISALAGLGEEMLFRGVFQASLARWAASGDVPMTGTFLGGSAAAWLALIVVAVLFGLAHAVNLGYALMAGLIGLYLGWLWMVSDSLMIPIITHAIYDFLALLYLVKIRHPRLTIDQHV